MSPPPPERPGVVIKKKGWGSVCGGGGGGPVLELSQIPANLPPPGQLCKGVFEDNGEEMTDRQEELDLRRQEQAVCLTQAYLKPAKN